MQYNLKDPNLSKEIIPKIAKTKLGIVEYVEVGSGPVVVTSHGAMGGYDQSLILAQTIGKEDFRYISISRPGYLGTPISSGRTPEQQADLIAALLDFLDISEASMMAVSGGGPAAIQFGLRHSKRCKSLILVSTCADKVEVVIPFSFKLIQFLARWPWFEKKFKKKAEKDLVTIARRSIRDIKILANTLKSGDTWPIFSTMLLSTFNQIGKRLVGTANDIEISRTASYPLEDLSVPVLVVHGTVDRLVDFNMHTKIYKDRVPNVDIFAIEGGEHVAIFTHRNIVSEKVSDFMQNYSV
jgi:pimeloyl-ACP methyl ester carboxylesterase